MAMGRPPQYTPEQHERIVQLGAQGLSVRKIAAIVGISKTSVGTILKREGRAASAPD